AERYTILDGQHRWMVARQLELEMVPVNQVAEPSLVQNIVTMFQIHKLRQDWELMPTALKLEVLIKKLQERNPKKLGALTGLAAAVVVRCKKLLTFSRRYQDLMLDPDPRKRVKADFFIEVYAVRMDRLVNSFRWFQRDAFTDRMLHRYTHKLGIKAVTDFRTIKQHITNARRANQEERFEQRFREFVDDEELGIEHLVIPSASVDAIARKLSRDVKLLTQQVRKLDFTEYYGEEDLWRSLERLLEVIHRQLHKAGRRRPN
ncbi:ParB/Srx family N-terminal domain-containing protein, partial [Candidatus Palauibacter sp.]|uniref:ParB/Srx family N-terminal domain-containing protein n=1 Tax=Candidatus Palauibacter sp. TaxID=3101350 RepID=UPI003B02B26B